MEILSFPAKHSWQMFWKTQGYWVWWEFSVCHRKTALIWIKWLTLNFHDHQLWPECLQKAKTHWTINCALSYNDVYPLRRGLLVLSLDKNCTWSSLLPPSPFLSFFSFFCIFPNPLYVFQHHVIFLFLLKLFEWIETHSSSFWSRWRVGSEKKLPSFHLLFFLLFSLWLSCFNLDLWWLGIESREGKGVLKAGTLGLIFSECPCKWLPWFSAPKCHGNRHCQ